MINTVNNPDFWDDLYKDKLDRWDLKTPTPVFLELLNKEFFRPKSSLLIAGCGKGYDAVEAAEFGLNVSAVDFSAEALESARKLALNKNASINFLLEDIFSLSEKSETRYDYIYDYVTYCSFSPQRRYEYAKTIYSLLKENGRFVFILFPVEKRSAGPPFGVDEQETIKIFSEFLTLESEDRNINSIKPRKGREILHIYRKDK